jgi:pterin-4a-carbinolamine dehydratase
MTDPERLARSYMFNSLRQRSLFLEELLNEELRTGHFAKIIVEGKQVVVEVWTHDLERVTELDKEYATTCDVIYKDVMLMSV